MTTPPSYRNVPQGQNGKRQSCWLGKCNTTQYGATGLSLPNIADVWRDHHALVLPSRFEGLPLSIVEAMLSERPVIATDVAGNKELLQDDVTGFIAAAPTVMHLDEAMERAWQRRGEWRTIGRAAGEAARAVLPKDPARAFADKLLAVAETLALAKHV